MARANSITNKMNEEVPWNSSLWSTWNNKTEKYGTTSLKQVMVEYFKDHSIGDIGGVNVIIWKFIILRFTIFSNSLQKVKMLNTRQEEAIQVH